MPIASPKKVPHAAGRMCGEQPIPLGRFPKRPTHAFCPWLRSNSAVVADQQSGQGCKNQEMKVGDGLP